MNYDINHLMRLCYHLLFIANIFFGILISAIEVPVIGLFHGLWLWFLKGYVTNWIVATETDGLDIRVFTLMQINN